MAELEAIWNATPRTDHEDQYMKVKTKSVFDPNKVNSIDGIPDWSDDHYKKPIRRSVWKIDFKDNALSRSKIYSDHKKKL